MMVIIYLQTKWRQSFWKRSQCLKNIFTLGMVHRSLSIVAHDGVYGWANARRMNCKKCRTVWSGLKLCVIFAYPVSVPQPINWQIRRQDSRRKICLRVHMLLFQKFLPKRESTSRWVTWMIRFFVVIKSELCRTLRYITLEFLNLTSIWRGWELYVVDWKATMIIP